MRWVGIVALLALGPVAAAPAFAKASAGEQDLVAKTEPLPPDEQLKKFKLPPGFTIALVAAEPDIRKPMNLAFDDRGRLWATESVEYPWPAKPGVPPRDRLKIFDDIDPTGRARRITVAAESLNIPIGQLPLGDGAIVHSIPKVWKVDGDKRTELLGGEVGSKDTHGMVSAFTPWIDGWIYACHGFANTSTIRGADGSAITMTSGNTWRFRPDGSRVEQFTHGQVNPFGLSFDSLGNLYSSDCHSKPIYFLLRDAWYPSFGTTNDGLGLAPDIMNHLHHSTANCGPAFYAADHFSAEYHGTVFTCNPMTNRINHDRLDWSGSSPRAVELPDFLTCDDPWFRPVDLKLGPDGALYVADFYNRIIGHYEVPLTHPGRDRERGRIWRITYDKNPLRSMADLRKATTAELVALLNDPNLTLRVKATNRLAESRADVALDALTPLQRAHALWVLERQGKLGDDSVRKLAADPDRLVRVHLLKALAERKEWKDFHALVRGRLADDDPFVRRAAADALGLHPDPDSVMPLIDLWTKADPKDAQLVYVVRQALRNHVLAGKVALLSPRPETMRRLVDVSLGARTKESAAFVLSCIERGHADEARFLHHALRYASAEDLPRVFALAPKAPGDAVANVRAVLQAAQERGAKLPDDLRAWSVSAVREGLQKDASAPITEALKLIADMRLKGLHEAIAPLAAKHAKRGSLRVPAIKALGTQPEAVPILTSFLADASESAPIRQEAATSLAALGARDVLATQLRTAPRIVDLAIATALAGSKEGAEELFKAVGEGKASPRLLLDRAVADRLKGAGLADRAAALTKELPPEDERLRKLADARKAAFAKAKPDAARGAEVFKKSCAGCHMIGGQGKKAGPDLDGMGIRGVERILEDVLDPNRNVDHAFRATNVKTKDGRVISGLLLREEGQVLVILEAVDKETRVPAAEVDQRRLSALSPMPTNFGETIPEAEFHDLVAWLLSQRQTDTK